MAAKDMRDAVRRLMVPRSIAIVGVSPEPGSPGGNVVGNLDRVGYTGAIHLVSRNRTEVFGRPCVRTIDDLPDNIDVVVLCIPERAVVEAVETCAKKRMGNVVIFAAGFAEVGGDGIVAQRRIGDAARAAGMGVVGPNCLGLTNSLDGGVPITFGSAEGRHVIGDQKTIGIVAQSGAFAGIFRNSFQSRGLAVSYSVSSGNEAGLTAEDYLDHMIEDKTVRVIAIYAEQLRDPPRFLALAARARSLNKPIVMLHAGSTEVARESAVTHTYSITGNYRAMRALVSRAGGVVVDKIEELLDTVELFMYFPTPPTMGPAVMADSGAFKGHALDYAEKIGIDLPKLSPEIYQALVPVMPVFAPPSNPLDMTAQAIKEPEMYDNSLPLLLADPRIGSLILAPIMGPTGFGSEKGKRILNIVRGAAKPVIMTNLAFDGGIAEDLVKECRAAGIPYFSSPERALRAIAYIAHYARALATPKGKEISVPKDFLAGLEKKVATPGALKLAVTASRDPDWGPIVEIGWGEPWRAALPDTIVLPPDLDPASVAAELGKLPGAKLFDGRDLGPVSDTIAKLGAALRADANLAPVTAVVTLG